MTRAKFSDHLPEILATVGRLRRRFAHTAPRSWDPSTAAAELTVQIGHFGMCLLRERGYSTSMVDDPQRRIIDPGNELADIVLAALSINVLANSEPGNPVPYQRQASDVMEAFLRLLVAAGTLSEVALVEYQYRHPPTGTPPSLSDAAAAVIGACDVLASHLGIDLLAEFRFMVADADSFLDNWSDAS